MVVAAVVGPPEKEDGLDLGQGVWGQSHQMQAAAPANSFLTSSGYWS